MTFPIVFEVPPVLLSHCNSLSDFYCKLVNTTWRAASLIQAFMEHAEPTLPFLLDTNIKMFSDLELYVATGKQLYV
jgi:uncharacterized protein YdaL